MCTKYNYVIYFNIFTYYALQGNHFRPRNSQKSSLTQKTTTYNRTKLKQVHTNVDSKQWIDMFYMYDFNYNISIATLISDVPVTLTDIVQQQSNDLFCRRCTFNPVSVVFLPCGHLCTCTDCAPSIKHCMLCKQLVKGTVRTYMA